MDSGQGSDVRRDALQQQRRHPVDNARLTRGPGLVPWCGFGLPLGTPPGIPPFLPQLPRLFLLNLSKL